MRRLNLVDESHCALGELKDVRKAFKSGTIDIEEAKQYIGFFNQTSRSIGVAISAEKWYKAKQQHKAKG